MSYSKGTHNKPHANRLRRPGLYRATHVPKAKRCPCCDARKPRHAYAICRATSDGLQAHCRHCLDRRVSHKRRRDAARREHAITSDTLRLSRRLAVLPRPCLDMRDAQRALGWLQEYAPPEGHAICSQCGQLVHVDNLAVSRRTKNGREGRCKRCKALSRRRLCDPNDRGRVHAWRASYLCTHTHKAGPLVGGIAKFFAGVNPYATDTYDVRQ